MNFELVKVKLIFEATKGHLQCNASSNASKLSKSIFRLLIVLSIFILSSCADVTTVRENEKPNIIVILLDDAGYNDFGFMGCKDLKTPNIDLLAQNGTIFTDAHVSASVCSPSRAGLMTGRYQQRFGHECNPGVNWYGTDTSEVMLPKALKEYGYTTAVIGKWHLGHKPQFHPNKRGFDYFYGFLAGGRSYFYNEKLDKQGNPRAILENDKQVDFEGYLTDVFGDKTIEFIDKNKENPFFIYLSYNAVHTPMEATVEDLELFEGHPRQTLAAMTWSVDRSIGNVVLKLKEEGLYENTMIFFLSDNGGAHNNQSLNNPLKGYKGNQFEGGHRIPFFVAWGDKFKSNKTFDGLTSSLDIFATSLDAAQAYDYKGEPLDGVSLLPYLSGEKQGNPHDSLFWRKANMKAARVQNHKLIYVDHLGYKFYNLQNNLNEDADKKQADYDNYFNSRNLLTKWSDELVDPLWVEGPVWDSISTLINTDLYNNDNVFLRQDKNLIKTKKEISKHFKTEANKH